MVILTSILPRTFARCLSMAAWSVPSTATAKAAINPIRECTEQHYPDAIKQSKKDIYSLGIGDPSVFGNLPPHPAVVRAMQHVLEEGTSYSYGTSYGYEKAREAVAEQFTTTTHPLTKDDVFMATGCAGALELCFSVLFEGGSNVLVPAPGYSLYNCLGGVLQVSLKYYNLLPDRSWEADLEQLEGLIDSKTRAILINNPSNPCGSVYSADHLRGFVEIARRHKLPIIADEVYANVVYKGQVFHSVSSVAGDVPVLTCGALSKRYLVPGWRMGWVITHDTQGMLNAEVKPSLRRLATRNIGPCALVQAALPEIFKSVPDSFFTQTIATFESNAVAGYERLSKVDGLCPVMPAGAMYMMVTIDLERFPEFDDDISFLKQLIIEQGVVCLPGTAFMRPGCMRIALIMPQDGLEIACDRIATFCKQHITTK